MGGLSGLAGDPDRGVLWGVAQRSSDRHALRDRSRDRRRDQARHRDNNQGATSRTSPTANGMLIVSDTTGTSERAATPRLLRSRHARLPSAPAGRHPGLRLRPGRRRAGQRGGRHRLLLDQRQCRRHAAYHHVDARRRAQRVRQQPLPRTPALRPERQPGGHRQRQRVRRQELGHRLHDPRRGQRHLVRPGCPVAEYPDADRGRIWSCRSPVPPVPWPRSP